MKKEVRRSTAAAAMDLVPEQAEQVDQAEEELIAGPSGVEAERPLQVLELVVGPPDAAAARALSEPAAGPSGVVAGRPSPVQDKVVTSARLADVLDDYAGGLGSPPGRRMVANPLARRVTVRRASDASDSSTECYINNIVLRSKRKSLVGWSGKSKAKTFRKDVSPEYKISDDADSDVIDPAILDSHSD